MKRLTVILALAMVLAACGSGDSGEETDSAVPAGGIGEGGFAVSPDTTAAAAEDASAEDRGGTIGVNLEVSQDRQVIRQASLELQADNTREAFDRIVELTENAGGFISNATVHPVANEGDQPAVVMTLRIPASQLTQTMTSIKASVEEVVAESQGAQDVTDQFIDLEARLTNLTALEIELRALLAEVRQQPEADPDKLLRVFTEISTVRGQIEQIQGQLNYLEDVVSLATLEISLSPTPAVVPIVEDTWRPLEVARDALRSLVSGLQNVAEWGIHFAIFTLPMLILTLGVPLLALYVVFRQWRKRRPPTEPEPAIPAES
ncbi:MAG TPA: DUF4349 domain-containing protein [Acidimicrobiia bacterium]|nr:DUF4349 domain-containing protein [Acidimicrobiia bacterium]